MRGNRGPVWPVFLAALSSLLLLPARPGHLRAQDAGHETVAAADTVPTVRLAARPRHPEERRLKRFLESGRYQLWTRDTVVEREVRVAGSVLVLEVGARISGRVEGDVYVVGGDLFLRPGARIEGDVIVLGGGWYASSRSEVSGEVVYRPNLLLRAFPREGGWEIFRAERPLPTVDLDGLLGVHAPIYQRVDGWTFGWGGSARARGAPWQPGVSGAIRFHTEGGAQLEGTLRHTWRPTPGFEFGAYGERSTRSNEDWLRGDFSNTISFLFGAGDAKNWYQAERAGVELGSTREAGWIPGLQLQWEEAESLRERELRVFFEDDQDVRPNPAIDDGKIWSATASLGYRRQVGNRVLDASMRLEGAESSVAGDFSFLRGDFRIRWSRRFFGGHTLELAGIGRGDLSGSLPRQRWSALGGHTGGLPTVDDLAFRGERLLFTRITYLIPVEALRVPVLGIPEILVRNAVGSAWSEGTTFRVEDNVTLGVRLFGIDAGVALNPTESDLDPEAVLGISLSRDILR